jgi:hypothetical protein
LTQLRSKVSRLIIQTPGDPVRAVILSTKSFIQLNKHYSYFLCH